MKNRGSREQRIFVYGILFISIAVLILSMFLPQLILKLSVLEKREVYASLIVSDRGGIDINSSALTFGSVVPGGSSSRKLIMKNKYDFPIYVEIVPKGDIAEFVSSQVFILQKDEIKEIGISASVPGDARYGNYTGFISVIMRKKPKLQE